MALKSETVFLIVEVELQYETEAARAEMIKMLPDKASISVTGCGLNGYYSMETVKGSSNVRYGARPDQM